MIKGSLGIRKTPGQDGEGNGAGRETPGTTCPQGWQKAQSLPAGRHKSPLLGATRGLHVPAPPACFSSGKESCERPMREQVGQAAPGTSQAGLDESRLPPEQGSQGTGVGSRHESSAGDPWAVSKFSHHELGRSKGWDRPRLHAC